MNLNKIRRILRKNDGLVYGKKFDGEPLSQKQLYSRMEVIELLKGIE